MRRGGIVATAVCKGSYDPMNAVMAAVAEWVTVNGYELDGPAFNMYHISPHEISDPSELVTEVRYPVRKK